jgi:hypothetical protein
MTDDANKSIIAIALRLCLVYDPPVKPKSVYEPTVKRTKSSDMTAEILSDERLEERRQRTRLFAAASKEVAVGIVSPIRPTAARDITTTQDAGQTQEQKLSRCDLLRLYSEKKEEIKEKRQLIEELKRRKAELELESANL